MRNLTNNINSNGDAIHIINGTMLGDLASYTLRGNQYKRSIKYRMDIVRSQVRNKMTQAGYSISSLYADLKFLKNDYISHEVYDTIQGYVENKLQTHHKINVYDFFS